MKEIWCDIKGYEGMYQISNLGHVRSLDRWEWNGINFWHRKGQLMKTYEKENGYWFVTLRKNNKPKCFYVHRLVAQAFIPNPKELPEINHKSEVKSENFVENLEWISCKDNNNYGTKNERMKTNKSWINKHKKALKNAHKAHEKAVYIIYPNGTDELFESMKKASEAVDILKSNVSKCCRGVVKSSHGYHFEYADA